MGRMSEYAVEQEQRDNESGIDMHDCYHTCHPLNKLLWHEQNHIVLSALDKIRPEIQGKQSNTALTESAQPF